MEIILIVTGAFLGFGLNYILQRLTYKDEYYKKIIEKRLTAYSDIERIVGILRDQKFSADKPTKPRYHAIFNNWDVFGNFYIELLETGKQAYWLNNETDGKFLEMQTFLRETFHSLIPHENSQKMGEKYYYELELLASQLQYLLFKDIKSIHKVRKFIKTKTPTALVLKMSEEELKLDSI